MVLRLIRQFGDVESFAKLETWRCLSKAGFIDASGQVSWADCVPGAAFLDFMFRTLQCHTVPFSLGRYCFLRDIPCRVAYQIMKIAKISCNNDLFNSDSDLFP